MRIGYSRTELIWSIPEPKPFRSGMLKRSIRLTEHVRIQVSDPLCNAFLEMSQAESVSSVNNTFEAFALKSKYRLEAG